MSLDRQVALADVLIINKLDLVDGKQLDTVRQAVWLVHLLFISLFCLATSMHHFSPAAVRDFLHSYVCCN